MIWLFLFFLQGSDQLTKTIEAALNGNRAPALETVYRELRPDGVVANDEEVLNGLGYRLLGNGKSDQAIAVFRLNMTLFPHQANPLDSLAEAYLTTGQPAEAVTYYQKAFEKQPNRDIWRRLGGAHEALADESLQLAYAEKGMHLYGDAEAEDLFLSLKIKFEKVLNPEKAYNKAALKFPGQGLWRSMQALDALGVPVKALEDGWLISDYAAVGLEPAPIRHLAKRIEKGGYDNFHGLVVVRENTIIAEIYGGGFSKFRPHDTRSAGKSVLALLVGLAVDQKRIKAEGRLYDIFPEYRQKAGWDAAKDGIQVRHLLAMSSGLDAFDDGRPSPGGENYYQENQKLWLDHVLRVPMAFKPGSQLVYASANYLLLGELIPRAVGKDLDAFAAEFLFGPLGINNLRWFRSPNGHAYGGGGIRMTPRDLAKIGKLVLDEGRWGDRQVVSGDWIGQMVQPQMKGQLWGKQYGFGWYVHQVHVKGRAVRVVSAAGNGGQRIWVMPELRAVAVVTMGNYNSRKANQADGMLRAFIVPSLVH